MDSWLEQLFSWAASIAGFDVVGGILGKVSEMTWQDGAEAIFVGMSVVGQHYISQRRSVGFWFWLFGNVVALFLFASLGRWPTVGLYLYFTWKCISGIRTWKSLEEQVIGVEPEQGKATKVAHAG